MGWSTFTVNDICPEQTAICTKCKQPKQSVHADRSQEIQQPQTNANKTFSSQRLECLATSLLHHGPENRIQKTSRNMAAIKGPRLCKYTFVRFDSVTSVFVCVPFVELVLRVSCKGTRFYFCTPLVRFGFVFEFYFLKKKQTVYKTNLFFRPTPLGFGQVVQHAAMYPSS